MQNLHVLGFGTLFIVEICLYLHPKEPTKYAYLFV